MNRSRIIRLLLYVCAILAVSTLLFQYFSKDFSKVQFRQATFRHVDVHQPFKSPVDQTTQLTDPNARFAYAFYGTSSEYVCSALVAIERLSTLGINKDIDIVLLHTSLSAKSARAIQNLKKTVNNFKTIQVDLEEKLKARNYYYRDCFLKIYIYSLYQYKRVIFMDSDGIPLKNLDHLFNLPPTPLASPRAYWLDNVFTSAFMVVQPNEKTFKHLLVKIESKIHLNDVFDMDLLNEEFRKTSLILPPEYLCLNSNWQDNHLAVFVDETLETLYTERCKYLHFTAQGKPWSFTAEQVKKSNPKSHPLFAEQFGLWHNISSRVC